MKRNLFGKFGAFILFVMLIATARASFAQSTEVAGEALVGTWDAVVSIENCRTGLPIRTFASIASFSAGGTVVGSTSGIPQSARTPEHGVWRHEYGQVYVFRSKTFSFDPMGAATGYSIITHTVYIDNGGNNYRSYGGVQMYTMNGTQVGAGCSSAVGTRMIV